MSYPGIHDLRRTSMSLTRILDAGKGVLGFGSRSAVKDSSFRLQAPPLPVNVSLLAESR